MQTEPTKTITNQNPAKPTSKQLASERVVGYHANTPQPCNPVPSSSQASINMHTNTIAIILSVIRHSFVRLFVRHSFDRSFVRSSFVAPRTNERTNDEPTNRRTDEPTNRPQSQHHRMNTATQQRPWSVCWVVSFGGWSSRREVRRWVVVTVVA